VADPFWRECATLARWYPAACQAVTACLQRACTLRHIVVDLDNLGLQRCSRGRVVGDGCGQKWWSTSWCTDEIAA